VTVLCEEGYGDTIQFVRYLPRLKDRGLSVSLVAPAPLRQLLQDSFLDVDISASASLDSNSRYVPLLSLPFVFGDDYVREQPAPYLRGDRVKRLSWLEYLGEHRGARVGLVWRGSPHHPNDRRRSLSIEQLGSALVEGLSFFALQLALSESELSEVRQRGVRHFVDELADFSDTAALIECLDLVISVDTSVAHLAGALGKPTWVLLPFVPDWRWMLEREDSPWYPSMKLYRQPSPGDWDSVLERVRADLTRVSSSYERRP
jgi:hypothetical protein